MKTIKLVVAVLVSMLMVGTLVGCDNNKEEQVNAYVRKYANDTAAMAYDKAEAKIAERTSNDFDFKILKLDITKPVISGKEEMTGSTLHRVKCRIVYEMQAKYNKKLKWQYTRWANLVIEDYLGDMRVRHSSSQEVSVAGTHHERIRKMYEPVIRAAEEIVNS